MTKIYLSFRPNWLGMLPSWASNQYSPDYTNAQKIEFNLRKLGFKNRFEWRKNMELIKQAIAPAVLENDIYIYVEKITISGSCLVLSMTINQSNHLEYFCGFILSSTLNFDSLYFVENNNKLAAVYKVPVDNVTAYDNCFYGETESNNDESNQADYQHTFSRLNIEDHLDDDDPEDDQFSYLTALNEKPEETAAKAQENGVEWYSFFLSKEDKESRAQSASDVTANQPRPSTPIFGKPYH